MRKLSILALITSLFVTSYAVANEVNVFNARHYKADGELYSKFTNMTGIKVNLINGKMFIITIKNRLEENNSLFSLSPTTIF